MLKIKTHKPKNKLSRLTIRRSCDPARPWSARLHASASHIRAALGRSGVTTAKREGDGATPAGSYHLRPGFIRKDRLRIPALVPLRAMRADMGWCDDPASGRYNRPVPAGFPASHERLWREDAVYDVVYPTSHNETPRLRGRGSAIFFHLARPDYAGTEGCVAIGRDDMRRLLPRLARKVRIVILP